MFAPGPSATAAAGARAALSEFFKILFDQTTGGSPIQIPYPLRARGRDPDQPGSARTRADGPGQDRGASAAAGRVRR